MRIYFEISCPLGDFPNETTHKARHARLGWRDTYCPGYLDENDLSDLLAFMLADKIEAAE